MRALKCDQEHPKLESIFNFNPDVIAFQFSFNVKRLEYFMSVAADFKLRLSFSEHFILRTMMRITHSISGWRSAKC